MIRALSYVIAVVLTLLAALVLYPIAAFFWLCGLVGKLLVSIFTLLGKLSDRLFAFTTRIIRSLWKELGNSDGTPSAPAVDNHSSVDGPTE